MTSAKAARRKAQQLLELAGIEINGKRPWDVQIRNDRVYKRVLMGGSLALGESYMDEWWDTDDLVEFFTRLNRANLGAKILDLREIALGLSATLFNRQSKSRVSKVAIGHYDIDNALYRAMLGDTLAYSCGYWRNANNLDEAQTGKFDLVCRKLGIRPGDRILDVGCGWGTFARFAAQHYGAQVTAITISKEQAQIAQQITNGLPIDIRLQDYRDVKDGPYDHIVSIGMFEHVGPRNYRVFLKLIFDLLKDSGLLLLHTIGSKHLNRTTDAWMDKYIFPNGVLPSIRSIGDAINWNTMVVEDWHCFGLDYHKTLVCWNSNFVEAWPLLRGRYDDKFFRMWTYYLLSSAATFKARVNDLWQIVISKHGLLEGYEPAR